MYDDPKFRVNWHTIAVHDEENIKGFFSDYRFLSNFWPAPSAYQGVIYPTSENAYQAAKVVEHQRQEFVDVRPETAKSLWKSPHFFRTTKTKEGWDAIKYDVMLEIIVSKFLKNRDLRKKLMETNCKFLEETNWWRDTYWGVCKGTGENKLGRLLMNTRDFWR